MKKTSIALASMIAVSGLVLCSAEAPTIEGQFVCACAGFALFVGGLYWLSLICGGDHVR